MGDLKNPGTMNEVSLRGAKVGPGQHSLNRTKTLTPSMLRFLGAGGRVEGHRADPRGERSPRPVPRERRWIAAGVQGR